MWFPRRFLGWYYLRFDFFGRYRSRWWRHSGRLCRILFVVVGRGDFDLQWDGCGWILTGWLLSTLCFVTTRLFELIKHGHLTDVASPSSKLTGWLHFLALVVILRVILIGGPTKEFLGRRHHHSTGHYYTPDGTFYIPSRHTHTNILYLVERKLVSCDRSQLSKRCGLAPLWIVE